MNLHEVQVFVLFLFYWNQAVGPCRVRLELMIELAHSWLLSVPLCGQRGGDRVPSGLPRETWSPRAGLGGSRGWGFNAAFPLSLQSQNKAKQCKDSAMEAGTWLAHLLSLGGRVAWTSLPPQHTSFTLGTQSRSSLSFPYFCK